MNEGNPTARRPRPWHLVYQAVSRGAAGLERGVEIGNLIADVVDTGASFGQEFSNRTVGLKRCQQLHLRLSQRE